jgi:hypothetical protein
MRLVNNSDIATMIGRSKQRASQITHEPGFPKPLDHVSNGEQPIWERGPVIRWLRKHKKELSLST